MLRPIQLVVAFGMSVGFAGWVLPAAAQTYTETYSGTINGQSVDAAGLFGTAGANIGGDAITTTWTYSLTNGSDFYNVPGSVQSVYGGTVYNNNSPILSVSVTINGITQTFSSNYYGYTALCTTVTCGAGFADAQLQNSDGTGIFDQLSNVNLNPVIDLTATQYLSAISTVDSGFFIGGDSFSYLDTSVAFNEVGVPEPSSLALLGGGLLAVGALRRRHRAATATS